MNKFSRLLQVNVTKSGLCIGCGLCSALDRSGTTKLERNINGDLVAAFSQKADLPEAAWLACPGKGVDYPTLFNHFFGGLPTDWRLGWSKRIWTGYASDVELRKTSSSGGITTAVLKYLLDEKYVDGVIIASQGTKKSASETSWKLVKSSSELMSFSQSVYVGVPMLESIRNLDVSKKYAMTATSEDCAALRELQRGLCESALAVKYIVGPYTGTTLASNAIQGISKHYGIASSDKLTSLKWRAGTWPGYFEARFSSGSLIRVKKIYYNFLIPFYVSKLSLTSMDFANDFTDLSIGDAWSPKFEGSSLGHSVVVCRTDKMEIIINKMLRAGLLELELIDPLEASNMHGHMIDFKRRGSFIRRKLFKLVGLMVPDNGIYPKNLPITRTLIEIPIFILFLLCRTKFSRHIIQFVPPTILGYLFNIARLIWKALSKPVKRKGLRNLDLGVQSPVWRKK